MIIPSLPDLGLGSINAWDRLDTTSQFIFRKIAIHLCLWSINYQVMKMFIQHELWTCEHWEEKKDPLLGNGDRQSTIGKFRTVQGSFKVWLEYGNRGRARPLKYGSVVSYLATCVKLMIIDGHSVLPHLKGVQFNLATLNWTPGTPKPKQHNKRTDNDLTTSI